MQRIVIYILTLITLTGCFKEVSYTTTIVLRPTQQLESGSTAIALPGVVAYAFDADTTTFTVTSYEEAMSGVMVDKETGEKISAFAASTPYDNGDIQNSITLSIDKEVENIAIVAIDTENKDYGYTTYKLGVNLPTTYMALNFVPWKEGKFKYGNWFFVVDEPYEGPEIPEVELPNPDPTE